MKRLTILAIAAAALVVPATMAEAKTGAVSTASKSAAASSQVRYAWLKSCPKSTYTIPCGSWTVTLTSGKSVVLKDAVVHPIMANGKVDKEGATSFAISGNGKVVSYFRKSDRKIVVRDVASGRVRALPGKAASLPKGLGMSDLDTFLSDDGTKVLIDYFDAAGTRPSLIVDLTGGSTRTLRADSAGQGFSPDGKLVLATRFTDENTTEFAVYDESGAKVNSQVVPQIVANNSPIALSDDGTTVGVLITTSKGKQRLRMYDLATDTVGDAVDLSLPKSESAHRLFFDASGNVKLWELRYDKAGNVAGATQRRVSPGSGATSVVDSFKVKSNTWTWWLPGE
ncbi:hypothetical protein J5X84_12775 [Streptosporangiaceae bacterium NEAU-GS5]|nr:hypothetical protein [Streptosporangiaceae bacterium NEAU-GS5]